MQLSLWMEREGLDDEAVASGVRSDRTTISRIRRGKQRPSWDLAARLRSFSLGVVTADDFLPDAPPHSAPAGTPPVAEAAV